MQIIPEASWLSFNRRVLDQTRRPDFPLLERLMFLGIWASNMDEFYAARISRAFLEERHGETYNALLQEALEQSLDAARTYQEFLDALEPLGVHILDPVELTETERRYFGAYLAEEVAPLTDLIEPDENTELNSQALYLAAGIGELQRLIRLPEGLPRLLPVPGRDGSYVRLGALVRMRSDLFLPIDSPLFEFRLMRLAQLARSRADWDELPEALETRLDGTVNHLEIEQDFPEAWAETLRTTLGLERNEVFRLAPPLDLSFVTKIVSGASGQERFEPLHRRKSRSFSADPWTFLDSGRELALYHPFDDYGHVEDFALLAATDPEVTQVRSTLYRIGRTNGIAEALIRAARAGKDVAVLLEGRARFDELSNLEWSLRFQSAGVRVLPLPKRKVHAKAFCVVRAGRTYVHLGTGNYNPVNGRLYTDVSLFSAAPAIGQDALAFFEALSEERSPNLKTLRTASDVRQTLLECIRAEAHPKGAMMLKFNHITDAEIIAALEDAQGRGARIDVIVRSTLTSFLDGVAVKSIIGRYLEHARLAAFKQGGAWAVWASSADAMPRNFDGRFELLFPITDDRARRKVLRVLRAQIADDRNTYLLTREGQLARWGGAHDGQQL